MATKKKLPKCIIGHTGFADEKGLPDTQNHAAAVNLPLQKVGIREFEHPAFVMGGTTQGEPDVRSMLKEIPADFSMYVDLDAKSKGISMSRLPRLLSELTYEGNNDLKSFVSRWTPQLQNVMNVWAKRILESVPDATESYIKSRVKVPKWKASPASGLRGVEYYETVWEVKRNAKGKMRYYLTLKVRYISTCPCSMHLSTHAQETLGVKRANPHMQPSYAHVKVELDERTFLQDGFVHALITLVEKTLVTIPYPMVKREDEQAIAVACGKHLMFCEDAARLLAKAVPTFIGIKDWSIVCNHDESIHSHFATAVTWKGLKNGLR